MSQLTYGIAVFPSKKIQDIANSYRMRYDPQYSKIPPHITLKESFTADQQTIDKLTEDLSKIAKETEPFDIEIKKVSSFSPITHTVYLKVEPNDTLSKLNEQMNAEGFPGEQAFSFVPHITISQDLSEDEHSDVYGTLKISSFDLKDTIDRFQLLYQLDDGSWTVYETYKLGE
ncbi:MULTISPECIES: YjcG family protein [Allobacillus]|uniref:Putative phosphoesterase KQ486_10885 n=1 Tax=Allobacillus halotolerans TaxID=570278 RepID=A0ABS6GSP5_9BACI|nr:MULTISPECIES: YjcG family protein [Allobacillus]MBU6081518.1 YjcG family protein [Allobacillus halotolerans]TSJ69459.1 hypothetical protein FPQ10_03170 [Allobacillus sp. SKP2-8]